MEEFFVLCGFGLEFVLRGLSGVRNFWRDFILGIFCFGYW